MPELVDPSGCAFVYLAAVAVWQSEQKEIFSRFLRLFMTHSFYTLGSMNPAHSSPLCHTALICSVEDAKLMIKYGADIRATYSYGRTMVHYAAAGGNLELLQFLLDSGLGVDIRDNDGRIPLQLAAVCAQADACTFLLRNGASVNGQDVHGRNSLHVALDWEPGREDISCPAEVLDVLLASNADPHVAGSKNRHKNCSTWVAVVETPASWARYLGPGALSVYLWSLHKVYPDIMVDEEGEVFWDAQEEDVPGYGCSYESVKLVKWPQTLQFHRPDEYCTKCSSFYKYE